MFSLNLDRCQTTENLQHSLRSKRFIDMGFQISWTFSVVLDNQSSFSFRGCSFLTVPLSMAVVKNVLTVFFSHARFCVSALVLAFPMLCSNWEQIRTTMVVPGDFWVCWKLVQAVEPDRTQPAACAEITHNSVVSLQTVAAVFIELIWLGDAVNLSAAL